MPRFEVEWKARGTAIVDADDAVEAGELMISSLENFETLQLDEFAVEETEILTTEQED